MNTTEHYQRTFAAHLRDPTQNPIPNGVNPARMNVYVDLLFNNVNDFLQRHLPITHSLLDANTWHDLVRQFYAQHACQSPYLRDISGEFVQWLSPRFATLDVAINHPYLLELVHFEWVEIALMLDDTKVTWQTDFVAQAALDENISLNPVMLSQSYQYPVHKITTEWQPSTPEPTFLLRLRTPQGQLRIIVLNALTMRLVEYIQNVYTPRQAITLIAEEISHSDRVQLLQFGLQLLTQFHRQYVITGVSHPHGIA